VARGFPQGSVLGPILFVIYIIDLPDCLKNDSSIYLYADDTKIIHNIKQQEDCEKLQEDIHCMHERSEKWLLKFHPDKCKCINISNKRDKINYEYTFKIDLRAEKQTLELL